MKELKENSFDPEDAENKIRSAVKDWYQGTEDEKKSIDKQGAIRRLRDYAGMSQEEAEKLVQQWTAKIATGIDYDKISDAYIGKEIRAERAESLLQTYGGKTAEEAKVHSVASFLNLGMKKAVDFFQNLRQGL